MGDEAIKDEFLNTTKGYVGVIITDGNRDRGIPVRPNETVWLSEHEQIKTANAPRREKDNPFVNGTLKLLSKGVEMPNRRPIGNSQDEQVQEEAKKAYEEQKRAEEEAEKKAEADRKAAAEKAKQEEMPPSPLQTSAPESAASAPAEGKTSSSEEVATPDAPAKQQQQPKQGQQQQSKQGQQQQAKTQQQPSGQNQKTEETGTPSKG